MRLQSVNNGNAYTRSYQYNSSGSVISDGAKQFKYNELGLPKRIDDKNNIQKVAYIYDAEGRKLIKNGIQETRHYIDGVEYLVNGTMATIDLLHTHNGLARRVGNNYLFEYFLKDHLGNTRVVHDGSANVLQQTDYYPFGLEINRKISSKTIFF
ncbi:hypothetical protein [Sphingobacterium griseoflavum]|uniref:Teneurin-like YD-shell domain-containing protein n=1 Tax=Sphingobacterium griseoflavum TaxID=1474952 RepID=A0ABQ3HYU2_9SPHI|nr:hypothetical protein [Sphingobacterium griseoflavum]GHE33672.1 hypothetical protein GCM10017764_16100 [Sphingobacterium griseoflavum]